MQCKLFLFCNFTYICCQCQHLTSSWVLLYLSLGVVTQLLWKHILSFLSECFALAQVAAWCMLGTFWKMLSWLQANISNQQQINCCSHGKILDRGLCWSLSSSRNFVCCQQKNQQQNQHNQHVLRSACRIISEKFKSQQKTQ